MGGFGTAFGGVPTPDPLAQFLGRVLAWCAPGEPTTYVNIHGLTPKWVKEGERRFVRKGGGRVYSTLVEYPQIQQFLFQMEREENEAFFCISTRSAYKLDRKGNPAATRSKGVNRAVRLKAWVLDLDVKAKGYRSQRDALRAGVAFLESLGLKVGPIVDTGYGIHIYLTIPVGISPEEWQPLANALIEAAKQAGLKFDVLCTRDDDHIFRVPGSTNRKDPASPKPCRLLDLGVDNDYGHLREVLAPFMGATSVSPRVNGGAPRIDPTILPQRPPITGPDAERALAEVERNRVVTSPGEVVAVCEVVNDSLWRHGNGDREPLWKELANLCHYLENGRDFFHDLSDGDPRYDEAATDQKYDERVLMGWPLCSTIAEASDAALAICKSCPLYQKGQSPLHAATRGDPPGEVHGGQVNGVNGHASPGVLSAAPFVTAGGPPVRPIWLREQYDYVNYYVMKGGQHCFNLPLLDVGVRYEDSGAGHIGFVEFTTPRGTNDPNDVHTWSIPTSALASKVKIAEAMGKYAFFPLPVKDCDVVTDIVTLVQQQRLAVTRERTGWTNDGTEFAFGGKVYTKDGARPGARPSDDYLIPKGDLEAWKGAANFLCNRGLTEIEIVMASGYTGPLVEFFPNVPGVFLYVWSGSSGRGKTAACAVACSVAANPDALVKSTASGKGHLKRIVRFNNIPVYFDELAPDNSEAAKHMAQLIKNTTSGSDTLRLTRPGTAEQVTLQSRNQVVGNGNRRITEIARVAETNAQAARVLEFEMPDKLREAGVQLEEMGVIGDTISHNYGVAMEVYIDYVVRHREQVKEAVSLLTKSLRQLLNANHEARFWVAQIATLIIGAKIASLLGLQKFDVSAIQKYLINWYRRHHNDVFGVDNDTDSYEVHIERIRNFYNDNLRARLITKHLPRPGRTVEQPLNRDLPMSPDELAFRIAVEDKRMYMSIKKYKDYCRRREQDMSFEQTKSVVIRGGAEYHRKGKSIGGSTTYYTAQEAVLEFNLADPRNDGFYEESMIT